MVLYDGVEFNSLLEAQWGAFFNLAGWTWRYRPPAVGKWKPHFRVTFPCSHSECSGGHTLLVTVAAVATLNGQEDHLALSYSYGYGQDGTRISADAGALFGTNPEATRWEMSHGAGGGMSSVSEWVHEADEMWEEAHLALRLDKSSSR